MIKKYLKSLFGGYRRMFHHPCLILFVFALTQAISPVFADNLLYTGRPHLNTAYETAKILKDWIQEMTDRNGGKLSAQDANLLNACLDGQQYRKDGNRGKIFVELDLTHGDPHYHVAFKENANNTNLTDHKLIPRPDPLHRIDADTDYDVNFKGPLTPHKRPPVSQMPANICTTSSGKGCTPKIVTTQAQNSPPTNTSFQSTPRTGLFRGFFRGVFNNGPFTPGGIAERGLGLWEGSEEVIEYIRNNRRELGTMATTYMGLAKYYSGYAGKVVISYAPTAGTTVGLGSAAIAPAAISLANLEYSQSQINAAKANGGFIPISGPVQTAGPNSIWVYGRVYAGPNGQLYQATSWGFSPVYNTYSDWWNGTQATAKR